MSLRKNSITNEKIDQFLLEEKRQIERLENTNGAHGLIKWRCLIAGCGYEWMASPNNVKYKKSGCPKCAKNAKITNETTDNFILIHNLPVKRLEDVKRSATKISWQCTIDKCHYIWQSTPCDIKNGYGCPKCAKTLKLTNDIMDEFLVGLNIKRLDDIKLAIEAIRWQCIICDYIWATAPNCIRSGGTGCPICSNVGKNEMIVYEYLKNSNINFIRQYEVSNNFSKSGAFFIDFFIPNKSVAIEYNGVQHYEPTRWYGIDYERAEANFKNQQKRDNFIRSYCANNAIQLIEIDGRKYKGKKLIEYIDSIAKSLGIEKII